MFSLIKKYISQPINSKLTPIKARWYKIWLFHHMQRKHRQLLGKLKNKKRIRVIFLTIHKSVWKADAVFKQMLADPFFEPLILICPYTVFGEERMWEDMRDCLDYFNEKGYPTHSSYSKKEERWVTLEELEPDIVFFSNPHNLTKTEYYKCAYLNYLSCYIPYSHDVSRYDNYVEQYNQNFHNSMWKIYAPHNEDKIIFKNHSKAKGRNVEITGYPACEELLRDAIKYPWKPQEKNKKRIIWAPHHTINSPVLPYSNFIRFSEFFISLAIKYKDEIQVAFKPHPILRNRLYELKSWGKTKTDEYYEYWATQSNTQLELGEYCDLFKTSDAMIHDSGSFLAEYHYVKKPVFYICSPDIKKFLNPFGLKALESCAQGIDAEDLERFILKLINSEAPLDETFFIDNITPYFLHRSPSRKVLESIKFAITGRSDSCAD